MRGGYKDDLTIHMLEYEMPDGREGRGFVGEFPTWSFIGPGKSGISDEDLVDAFAGWLFVFLAKHDNAIEHPTEVQPETERFLLHMEQAGFRDIEITQSYLIYGYMNWEFRANKDGVAYKGAGDDGQHCSFPADSPRCTLPLIYTFFGLHMEPEGE